MVLVEDHFIVLLGATVKSDANTPQPLKKDPKSFVLCAAVNITQKMFTLDVNQCLVDSTAAAIAHAMHLAA